MLARNRIVSIIGMGLIGGSLGRALMRNGWATRVIGIGRRASRLRTALRMKACHEFSTDLHAVRGSDLVIIAVPVKSMGSICRRIASSLGPGAVVTDCGSTKERVIREANQALAGQASFVGAHPMAGSEKSGVQDSDPALFRGAACVITPVRTTSPRALRTVREMWRSVGARVFSMSPERHDRAVALTSHLPHLLADILVEVFMVGRQNIPEIHRVVGRGFRDMTRIASSDPEIWADIFDHNRINLAPWIDQAIHELTVWKRMIRKGDGSQMARRMNVIRKIRRTL